MPLPRSATPICGTLLADGDPEVAEAEARQSLQLRALLRDRTQRAAELTALSDSLVPLTAYWNTSR